MIDMQVLSSLSACRPFVATSLATRLPNLSLRASQVRVSTARIPGRLGIKLETLGVGSDWRDRRITDRDSRTRADSSTEPTKTSSYRLRGPIDLGNMDMQQNEHYLGRLPWCMGEVLTEGNAIDGVPAFLSHRTRSDHLVRLRAVSALGQHR